MQIAVPIWKPDNTVCIRGVEKLRIIAGRIKRDTERIIQAGVGK